MKPNGGKSHLTPISHFFRLFTADGSAGSLGLTTFFFFGFGFAVGTAAASLPPGAAVPQAANAAAASRSAARTIVMRFIQPLLLRWSALPVSRRAGASGAESVSFAPPLVGRGRRSDRPARRSCRRP